MSDEGTHDDPPHPLADSHPRRSALRIRGHAAGRLLHPHRNNPLYRGRLPRSVRASHGLPPPDGTERAGAGVRGRGCARRRAALSRRAPAHDPQPGTDPAHAGAGRRLAGTRPLSMRAVPDARGDLARTAASLSRPAHRVERRAGRAGHDRRAAARYRFFHRLCPRSIACTPSAVGVHRYLHCLCARRARVYRRTTGGCGRHCRRPCGQHLAGHVARVCAALL